MNRVSFVGRKKTKTKGMVKYCIQDNLMTTEAVLVYQLIIRILPTTRTTGQPVSEKCFNAIPSNV